MNTTPRHPRLRHAARGAAVVEFALLLTLMISLIAGITEFGRIFWYYDALSKATRNAARAMSVRPVATIASLGVAAVKADVDQAADEAGLPAFGTANVLVMCMDGAMIEVACADGTTPTGVKVSIVAYPILLGSSIPFLVGADDTYTINLAPATTMPYMR